MRIGVNTRLLLAGKMDGIGWFTAETLRRIVQEHPEHDFYFFFDRKPDPVFLYAANVHPVVLCPQARHPVLWFLFFEVSVRWALKHYKIDLFLSPECYLSLGSTVPTLMVIHDINYEHTNDNLKPSHQRYMKYFSPRFAHHSTRIATVSEFSKQDIVDTYKISPDKIDVVYDGAHEGYHPLDSNLRQQIRDQYAQGCPYFIFVGTIIKRKNLATVLTAFDLFKAMNHTDMKLVVVGHKVWWQDELKDAFDRMRYQDSVIFIGRATAELLVNLLGAAEALVYPSLFEGFGIPIIEAFHAEIPVITSNCTSMPEVAGDAAILVEPADVTMLADALQTVSSNCALRAELVEKGRSQRERFSWDKSSAKLWDSMMKTWESSR
ncbi:MAG: glycosyltransferase family 4 protein [Bacteroidales bacterium]|nr:glycosyltransferase family 4 protein [Bacteroidales bacterium]